MRHLEQADNYLCYLKKKGLHKKHKKCDSRDLLCKIEELLCSVGRERREKNCRKD